MKAFLLLLLLALTLSLAVAAEESVVVYDHTKIKDSVAVLEPSKNKIYFALYNETLSPAARSKIKESQQLEFEHEGKSYKVIAYIQLTVKPDKESFQTSDVTGYIMEFTGADGGAALNWVQPMKDGISDISAVKSASGIFKLGEKASLKMEGERTFSHKTPPYKWNVDLTSEILLIWG